MTSEPIKRLPLPPPRPAEPPGGPGARRDAFWYERAAILRPRVPDPEDEASEKEGDSTLENNGAEDC